MSRENREKQMVIWTDIDTYHDFYKLKDKAGFDKNHEMLKDMIKTYKSHKSFIDFTGSE